MTLGNVEYTKEEWEEQQRIWEEEYYWLYERPRLDEEYPDA